MIEFVFPSEQSDCSRATAYSSTIRLGKSCRPSNQNEELCGRQLRTMKQKLGGQACPPTNTARDARAIRAHSIPKRTALLCYVRVASYELRDNSSFPESH